MLTDCLIAVRSGLAVKVLWVLFRGIQPTRELAAEQFNNHVNFYCQGQRFTTAVRQALFTLLITDKPTQNVCTAFC
jgi:hypothetical protein